MEYRSHFNCAFRNVSTARKAVVDFAAHWLRGEDLADIECAVGEALANSAEHGSKTNGSVDVYCVFEGDRFIVEVKDVGSGFEPPSDIDSLQPHANATRGFGIYIMRELMDEIEYRERGTRVRLVKIRRPAAHECGQQAVSPA